ncbi:DEAD/DEAH box helicase [Thiosulfatimonas sediminis]|uniref:DEAD/DEAH box helicase n=1 Tax=Thiosulfatimonas sediminis TaxID=2675054 RepID=UPI0015666981|nr:DEAD/DEAH box helicase [Thiosulfatimonas sediminis]
MNDAGYPNISAIDNRLAELENEKQQLLALREALRSAQNERSVQTFTPEQKVALFRQRFRGREDIFANRWQNQQGRSGYSVACDNEWVNGVCNKPRIKCQDCSHRKFSELNEHIIYRHLAGHQVVGLYPLLKDNTCYLLAVDFDKGCWQEEAKAAPIKLESLPKNVTITLANHIYFLMSELPGPLLAGLKRLASFSNPVFFKTQALRFSTHGIPRFISCARIENGYLALPRGCLDDAIALLQEQNISPLFDDKRETGKPLLKLSPEFTLRKNQRDAVAAITKHDFGILHAPTAFGKTVTAIGMIVKRKVNTLILVHSRQLLEQWQERLRTFLPEASIGSIGGGKRKPSGIIDIATYQSLVNKKDNSISPLIQDYGHIIVDECHHLSAPRFEMVLNEVRAKYVLGLTATPERQDGHQKIIFMTAGPIRYKVKQSPDEQFTQTVIIHQLYDVPSAELITTDERPKISDAYRWLVDNEQRTSKIVSDASQCVQNGGHPLVLTERREHAEYIHSRLTEMGISTVVLKGAMKAAERKNADNHLQSAQVIVATGKYVGEGFDLPRLDTLFLAMPIAWKGTLAQYAGRIHRESEGKTQVTINDYVDCALPMLQRMFKKREKSYKAMGYALEYIDDNSNKQPSLKLENASSTNTKSK